MPRSAHSSATGAASVRAARPRPPAAPPSPSPKLTFRSGARIDLPMCSWGEQRDGGTVREGRSRALSGRFRCHLLVSGAGEKRRASTCSRCTPPEQTGEPSLQAGEPGRRHSTVDVREPPELGPQRRCVISTGELHHAAVAGSMAPWSGTPRPSGSRRRRSRTAASSTARRWPASPACYRPSSQLESLNHPRNLTRLARGPSWPPGRPMHVIPGRVRRREPSLSLAGPIRHESLRPS
jgi:hypothetical protein